MKKADGDPGCFGDFFVGQIEAERDCWSCTRKQKCITLTKDRGKKSAASGTKLDSGKPKLSLLYPELVEMLFPISIDEPNGIANALYTLSRAAHATNKQDFSLHLRHTVHEIVEYLESPRAAMVAATRAMEYGANKPEYGRNNWKKGFNWSRLIDAAMRHGLAIASGELIDQDSGNEHVAHMLGAINMLLGNVDMGIGVNDIY